MKFLKNIFWNGEESRLRTGYRLIMGFILYIAIAGGLKAGLTGLIGEEDLTSDSPVWVFVCYACILLVSGLLSIWLAGRFLDRRPFTSFGFHFNKDWWIDLSFGMGLGVLLMAMIFLIELAAGWLTISSFFYLKDPGLPFFVPILVCFFVFIGVGVSEELLIRGYILKNLSEGLNYKAIGPKGAILIAWLVSSILFGLFHINNPNASLVSTSNIIFAGILLGLPYVLTGELAIPIGLHITWNFFQGNVFGLPVSGKTMPGKVATFFKVEQSGPELWTGGAFGPEAGLIGLFAMLLGLTLILGWIRLRYGANNFRLYEMLASPPEIKNQSSEAIPKE